MRKFTNVRNESAIKAAAEQIAYYTERFAYYKERENREMADYYVGTLTGYRRAIEDLIPGCPPLDIESQLVTDALATLYHAEPTWDRAHFRLLGFGSVPPDEGGDGDVAPPGLGRRRLIA